MNCRPTRAAIGLLLALSGMAACAQASGPAFPGNEAVRFGGGKRVVDLPPLTPTAQRSVQGGAKMPPPSAGGEVFMIEAAQGLMECRGPFFAATGCRPSSIGKTKRPRLWTVKLGGVWEHCNSRIAPRKCEPVSAGAPGAMGTVE